MLLWASPFLAIALAAPRASRVPGLHQALGASVFAGLAIAIWILAGRAIRSGDPGARLTAIGGMLFVLPFALVALLWVGLGPPWEADAAENQMRYVVLVTMAAAVISGCVVLKEALGLAGERSYATLGLAAILVAGPPYTVGEALQLAASSAQARTGRCSPR